MANADKQQTSTWSEKQGKSKSFDYENANIQRKDSAPKVEPKFKVGDWVVRGNTIAQILDIQEQYYIGLDIYGNDFTSSRFLSDDKIHRWTIEDAQPGDVIVLKNEDIYWIILFKSIKSFEGKDISYYVLKSADDTELIINETCYAYDLNYLYPATTKQQQILFKAIENTGYEWDNEEKVLRKLEVSNKPKWTEKDQEYVDDLENYFIEIQLLKHDKRDVVAWLKTIKQRMEE